MQQSTVETAFYFREFGVIAEDPDDKQEILYLYANAGNKAEYINDKTSTAISDKIIDILVKEDNTDNITISIDNTNVYVERQEYQNKINEIQTNLEIKADKAIVKRFSIDTTEWTHDATTNTYTHTIAETAITNEDLELIDVYYDTEIKEVAQDAEIKITSTAGQLIFTVTSVPTAIITGTYKVEG